MRKIVAGMMMSVNGVVEAPETWTGPYFSSELGQHVESVMAAGDTMLLGRVTSQTFAAAFAGNTSDPMAAQMNATPKVVVSTTLDRADWENSILIRGTAREITALKQQPGKNINISGSATFVAWLLREGLLDELDLLVFPGSSQARANGCSATTLARPRSRWPPARRSRPVSGHLSYRPAST